jgi:Ca2+-binding RTX toxin-like protein
MAPKPYHKTRLELERLEDRRVLACSVSWAPPGVLTILGTAAADSVSVHASGGHIIVNCYSAGDPAPITKVFNGGPAVTRIVFRGFAGNDDFKNETALPVTAFGGAGNDLLVGGSGSDWLQGDDGNDILAGRAGNDRLYGRNGADRLYGGDHDDQLDGGADGVRDYLWGQLGVDTFVVHGWEDIAVDLLPGEPVIP